jgi:hypothetical protein
MSSQQLASQFLGKLQGMQQLQGACNAHGCSIMCESTLQELSIGASIIAIGAVVGIWLPAKHGTCRKLQTAITLQALIQLWICLVQQAAMALPYYI